MMIELQFVANTLVSTYLPRYVATTTSTKII